MRAVKKVRRQITDKPTHESSVVLSQLVLSLENEKSFEIHKLYDLKMDDFELAIEVLQEWRLDRYYEGKSKLLNVAIQASQMQQEVNK